MCVPIVPRRNENQRYVHAYTTKSKGARASPSKQCLIPLVVSGTSPSLEISTVTCRLITRRWLTCHCNTGGNEILAPQRCFPRYFATITTQNPNKAKPAHTRRRRVATTANRCLVRTRRHQPCKANDAIILAAASFSFLRNTKLSIACITRASIQQNKFHKTRRESCDHEKAGVH